MPRRTSNRDATKFIRLNRRACKACWKCVEACPNGVIGRINVIFHKHSKIKYADKCKGCQKCVKACEQQAITAFRIEKKQVGAL